MADAAAMQEFVEKLDLSKGVLLQVQSPTRGTDDVLLKEWMGADQK